MSSTVTKTEQYRLKSTDWIKLTNLVPPKENGSRNNLLTGQHQVLSNAYGQSIRQSGTTIYNTPHPNQPSASSPAQIMHPSPNSFFKGIENWELRGTMCLNFENSLMFHVEIGLSQGKNLDVVGSTFRLSPCLSRNNRSSNQSNNTQTLSLLQDIQIEVTFADSRMNHKKFVTLSVGDTWDSCELINDFFLPMDVFRSICKKCKNPLSGTSEEFEYVDALVEVNFSIKWTTPLWPPTCTTAFQQTRTNQNISLVETNDTTSISRHSSIECIPDYNTTNLTMSDQIVIFKVGENLKDSVAIHSSVLKNRSVVFKTMLEAKMSEGKSRIVNIPDVNLESMSAFAKCLYGKNLPNDLTTTVEVLKLAHKYIIEDIVQAATRSVVMTSEPMDLVLALNIFAAGNRLKITDLEFQALKWLKSNGPTVSSTAGKEVIQDFMQKNFDLLPAFLSWLF